MSIYIIALSIVPCSDSHNICDKREKKELTKNHNHQDDDNDNCSPFCICNCCGSVLSVINFQSFTLNPPSVFCTTDNVILITQTELSSFKGKIWQPPKIIA